MIFFFTKNPKLKKKKTLFWGERGGGGVLESVNFFYYESKSKIKIINCFGWVGGGWSK